MPKKCSVIGCKTGYDPVKKRRPGVVRKGIAVYSFPRDPVQCQAWVDAMAEGMGLGPSPKVTGYMGICELHWPPDATRVRRASFWIPDVPPSLFSPVRSTRQRQAATTSDVKIEPNTSQSVPEESQEEKKELSEKFKKRWKKKKGPKQDIGDVVSWAGWKEQYFWLASKLERLQELTKVDLEYLELSMDADNFPEVKNELDKIRLAKDIVEKEYEKQVEIDFTTQDFPTKMSYLDGELYDLFSMLSDQEMEEAFQWFMETEATPNLSFPKLLIRLNSVKANMARKARKLVETQKKTERESRLKSHRYRDMRTKVKKEPRKKSANSGGVPGDSATHDGDAQDSLNDDSAEFDDAEPDRGDPDMKLKTEKDLEDLLKQTPIQPGVAKHMRRVTCTVCNKVVSRDLLKRHVRSVHWNEKPEKRTHLCNICGRVLFSKATLAAHIHVHNPARTKMSCDICHKSFINLRNFKVHQKNHFKSKSHPCPLCPKKFLTAWEMRSHCKHSHAQKDQTFVCSDCSKVFANKRALMQHIKKFHPAGTDPLQARYGVFQCALCQLTFTKRHLMAAHMLTHPEMLTLCALCGHMFETTPELHEHVKSIHLEEKDFECPTCGKKFFTYYTLQEHRQSHKANIIDETSCSICEKVFATRASLKQHKELIHGPPRYKCEHCHKIFRHSASYYRHLPIHGGERPYKCSLCDKAFIHRQALAAHMWTHMSQKKYKCDQCEAGYNDKRALTSHIRKTHSLSSADCQFTVARRVPLGSRDRVTTPRDQISTPRDQITTSRDQIPTPIDQITPSRDQMTDPRDHIAALRDQLTGTRDQLMDPRDQLMAQRDQLMVPRDQLMVPRDQLMAPRDQLMAPRDQLMAPRDQYTLPTDQYTAPRDQVTVPRDQLTVARDLFSMPSGQFTAPSSQFTVPRGQFTTPSGQITAPNGESFNVAHLNYNAFYTKL